VLGCVPGAEEVWLDADWDQIVMSIGGTVQPMGNLSAGQRMMLAMVADLAIKCVTQNAYLITEEDPDAVLRLTPGVVLIDELDVHLHPKWQRRVASDLKRTFPAILFARHIRRRSLASCSRRRFGFWRASCRQRRTILLGWIRAEYWKN
jgi:predicted ATP-binding protein involved in virulence